MTVSEEISAPKRSRLSLKGVRKYPPKPTLDGTSPLKQKSSLDVTSPLKQKPTLDVTSPLKQKPSLDVTSPLKQKPTLDHGTSPLKSAEASTSTSQEFPTQWSNTELPDLSTQPRTPDQPIVISESPTKHCDSPEKRREKPVIAAFNNLGNTCFLNSVLQILRYTPGFVTSLNFLFRELLNVHRQRRCQATEDKPEASAPWRLVRCLQKLYQKMDRVEEEFEEESDDSDLAVQPEKLLETIRELNPMYEGNFQHDAQELLHCILCFIKDAVQELAAYHDQNPTCRPVTVSSNESLTTTTLVANGDACHGNTSGGGSNGGYVAMEEGRSMIDEVVEVKLSKDSLSSLSDAIGDVVINDVTVVEGSVFSETENDVTDYDAPTQEFGPVAMDTGVVARDVDELPPPPNGFPTAEELFGDESMESPRKEGRMETTTVAMETKGVAKDRINDTIDRVLRGEGTSANNDWQRDWVPEENDIYFNFDNPSDALCEENRAIAESLKDAAAMASVASAVADGKLAPRPQQQQQTPKTSPVKEQGTSPRSNVGSPTTNVTVELCSQSSLRGSQSSDKSCNSLKRASTSSSAVKVQDEIEVLEEVLDTKPEVADSQDSVFAQPLGMRGGAKRETKVARKPKTSPTGGPKSRKGRRSRGLSVCNGDVNSDIPTSPVKAALVDEIPNGFHGKENIPTFRTNGDAKDCIFPPAVKSYSRKKPQPKEVLSPVRRSPRKLNQKKETEEEIQGTKLTFDPIEVKVNGEVQTWEIEMTPSPSESQKSGPIEPEKVDESASRKRVLSPNMDVAEPRTKRHSTEEIPTEEESNTANQTKMTSFFPKKPVVRRLGMHNVVSRKSKSPETKIDLTTASQDSGENDVTAAANVDDVITDDITDGTPAAANQNHSVSKMEDEVEKIEIDENEFVMEDDNEKIVPGSPELKQTAMDNAQTMRVRLEKCDLKEKYPELKVSTTPPKTVTFNPEPCRLVENLFEGRVALRTRCLECEASSDRLETFRDVSVPVKKGGMTSQGGGMTSQTGGMTSPGQEERRDELSDDEMSCTPSAPANWMLRELSEVEHLREENKYFCEACHQLVEAERSTHYDVMPQILTLHLKRFAATAGFFGGLSKITDHVTIPLTLPCFGAKCTPPCPVHRYELYGLVMHSGVTITSGHYVSYVRLNADVIKSRDDVTPLLDDAITSDVTDSRLIHKWSLEGRWIECDDSEVKVLSDSDFEHVLSESNFGTPYVLFYRLCHL